VIKVKSVKNWIIENSNGSLVEFKCIDDATEFKPNQWIVFLKNGKPIGCPGIKGALGNYMRPPSNERAFIVHEVMDDNHILIYPAIVHEGFYPTVDTEVNNECEIVINWHQTKHMERVMSDPEYAERHWVIGIQNIANNLTECMAQDRKTLGEENWVAFQEFVNDDKPQ
jgi:hypothetical protein